MDSTRVIHWLDFARQYLQSDKDDKEIRALIDALPKALGAGPKSQKFRKFGTMVEVLNEPSHFTPKEVYEILALAEAFRKDSLSKVMNQKWHGADLEPFLIGFSWHDHWESIPETVSERYAEHNVLTTSEMWNIMVDCKVADRVCFRTRFSDEF